MALGGTIRPLTIRVIIHAVVYQLAMSCEIITMNRIDVLSQFYDLRTDHAAKLINFKISGIEWSDPSSNETYEVFDLNLFSWAREDSETLTQLPIDYSILSLGLSRVAIMDILVNISSGCVQGLPFQEQRRLVTLELLKLTNIGKEPLVILDGEACIRNTKDGDKDLICHSVYSRRSTVTGAWVGVGKSCCTRFALRSRMYKKCFRHDRPEDFEAKSVTISVIGFLLPFIIIPGAVAWYQYNPVSTWGGQVRHHLTDYRLKSVIQLAFFNISSVKSIDSVDTVGIRLNEMTVAIDEHKLEPYEGAVSLFDLLHFKMRGVSDDKIKLTLLFLLQYVPVVSWLVYYSYMNDTLLYLNSSEKIIFSLRNNPYSWLWTDSSLWPHRFAIFLVILNSAPVLPLIVWWLLEFPLIRSRLIKCQIGCGLINNPKETLQKMFKIFFCILVICSYITIYSLCNSIIYVIGSLIVSIDIVSSWLTGGLLALYYTQRSYRELVEKYTQIKEVMFKQCMKRHTYQATHTKTEESFHAKDKLVLGIRNRNSVFLKTEQFEGPVWFVKQGEHRVSNKAGRATENQGISNTMMSKEKLFDLCEWIHPIRTGIRKAVVKLTFTLLFLALVVFSMNVFHPNAATKEASVLITSMGTLLAALIPRLAEMMGTGAEERIDVAILKSNIKEWLSSVGANSEFDVIVESKPRGTGNLQVSEMQIRKMKRFGGETGGAGGNKTRKGSYTNEGCNEVMVQMTAV